LISARILLWRSDLKSMEPELINCAIKLEKENLWLARRCLNMAYRISPAPETQQRLAAVSSKIEAIEQAASAKLEQKEERARADRVERLLSEAIEERQQGKLVNAMVKIDEALKQDPESSRVREQLSELQEQLGGEAEVLTQLGDRLYRTQQTAAAIAICEAALKLDPNQEQIAERILRARTVLNKLESIRSSTQPSSP
jgi:tetratricopeptide (TPR) repeat protein